MRQLNRREAVRGGLLLGAGLILTGCKGGKTAWKPLTPAELEGPARHPVAKAQRRTPAAAPGLPSGVIARREWTSAGPILPLINPMNGVNRITVHHSGVIAASVRSKADSARMLESIRRGHTSQQWADIGYHYIIDPQGRVWEGRSARYQGAHVKENNEHNLGIMCLGDFDTERPTSEALGTLDAFVADRMRVYNIPLSRVFTHQEINPTACPGRNLQSYMLATRSGHGRLATA